MPFVVMQHMKTSTWYKSELFEISQKVQLCICCFIHNASMLSKYALMVWRFLSWFHDLPYGYPKSTWLSHVFTISDIKGLCNETVINVSFNCCAFKRKYSLLIFIMKYTYQGDCLKHHEQLCFETVINTSRYWNHGLAPNTFLEDLRYAIKFVVCCTKLTMLVLHLIG